MRRAILTNDASCADEQGVPLLLLVNNGLDDHGGRVDPRQGHEEREGARDGQHKSEK